MAENSSGYTVIEVHPGALRLKPFKPVVGLGEVAHVIELHIADVIADLYAV